MAHAAARRGFFAGWVYGLGAIAGDLAMLALTLLGVGRVVERFPLLRVALGFVGAILMLWFAVGAWRVARREAAAKLGRDADDRREPWWRSFGKAFAIVTTSPYNWGFWLTAGNGALALFGATIVLGFFAGVLLWTALWTALAHAGGARLTRFSEMVSYAAAVALAIFAAGLFAYAVAGLRQAVS